MQKTIASKIGANCGSNGQLMKTFRSKSGPIRGANYFANFPRAASTFLTAASIFSTGMVPFS